MRWSEEEKNFLIEHAKDRKIVDWKFCATAIFDKFGKYRSGIHMYITFTNVLRMLKTFGK